MAELKPGISPVSEIDPKILDPDGLYIPRDPVEVAEEQQMITRGSKDLYQAPFRPPFNAVDLSQESNINPRADEKEAKGPISKHAAANRDHSKDGERDLDFIEDEYMNKAPKEEMLENYSIDQLEALLEAEEGGGPNRVETLPVHPDSDDSELVNAVLNDYRSAYDGVSTFDELMQDEPEFEGGTDTGIPDFLKEAKVWKGRTFRESRGELETFFRENPKALKKDIKAAYQDHKDWAQKKGIEAAWPETFKRMLARAQTSTAATPAANEPPRELSKSSQEIAGDIESTGSSHVEDTFRNLIDVASKIASRETMAPHHGFIYGTGGVGKSYSIVRTVEDICASDPKLERWKLLKGSTTAAALYHLLFKYRDGWVIIFDDNDGVLNDVNAINYLKAAMDPDQPRFVSKSSIRTLEDKETDMARYLKEDIQFYESRFDDDEEEEEDSEEELEDDEVLDTRETDDDIDREMLRKKNLRAMRDEKFTYWIDHVDPAIDPATIEDDGEEGEGGGFGGKPKLPPEFQFASRIIFISNRPDLPQPLQDRTEPGEVKLSKAEILDRIEAILDHLVDKEPKLLAMKDNGRALKIEVLHYLRACVKAEDEGISDKGGEAFVINAPFTFRLFARCVAYRVLYPDVWKKRVIRALREKSAGKVR